MGLTATLIAANCVGFADTGAYFVGKYFGKTQLTRISPKKTVEGAFGGLLSSMTLALLGWKLIGWPGSAFYACAIGVCFCLHPFWIGFTVADFHFKSFWRFDRIYSQTRGGHEGSFDIFPFQDDGNRILEV